MAASCSNATIDLHANRSVVLALYHQSGPLGDCARAAIQVYCLDSSDRLWEDFVIALTVGFACVCLYVVYVSGRLIVFTPSAWVNEQPALSCKRVFAADTFPELVLSLRAALEPAKAASASASGQRCQKLRSLGRLLDALFRFLLRCVMSWLGCAPVTEELPQLISQVLKSAIAILERMAARHESHYVPKADQAHAPPPPSAFSSANPTGVLRIHLREANGLRGVDLGGSSDPYVVVCAGELETRSEVIRKSRDPRFHQTIWLGPVPLEQLVAASKGELTVRVMDRNSLRADVLLGTARLVLGPLEGAPTVREYVVPLTREPSTSAAIVQPLPLGTAPPPPPAPPPPAATAVDGTISLAIDFVEVHPDAKGRLRPWPLYVCSCAAAPCRTRAKLPSPHPRTL